MKSYAIRITVERQDDTVKTYCDKYSDIYAIGAEVGSETDKPHYHLYLESEKSRQTLSNNIKKTFNVSGNEGFSLAIAKFPTQAKAYVAKECLVFSKGIDWSVIPKYVKFADSKRKTKSPTFTTQMLTDFGSRVLSPRSICDWVQDYLRDKCKIHDKFIVERFTHLLIATTCPTAYEQRKATWSNDIASVYGEFNRTNIDKSCLLKEARDPNPPEGHGILLDPVESLLEARRVARAYCSLKSAELECKDIP